MLSEADTPIDERFLWLEGRVSTSSMKIIKSGLPSTYHPTQMFFLLGLLTPIYHLPSDLMSFFRRAGRMTVFGVCAELSLLHRILVNHFKKFHMAGRQFV